MSYVILCKREGRPTMHVAKPNVMSEYGQPLVFADKDEAMSSAQEWATIFKGMHPDYRVVVKKHEAPPAPRRIIRRSA